jgi:hypothetical protein
MGTSSYKAQRKSTRQFEIYYLMTETVLPFELPATDDSGFVQKTYIDPQVEPLPTG